MFLTWFMPLLNPDPVGAVATSAGYWGGSGGELSRKNSLGELHARFEPSQLARKPTEWGLKARSTTEHTEYTEGEPNISKLILEAETHRVLGACFEVYKEKGCGFVEPVYQECLELELAAQGIEFLAQHQIGLSYKVGLLINFGSYPGVEHERFVI